jgi:hypothetical protein
MVGNSKNNSPRTRTRQRSFSSADPGKPGTPPGRAAGTPRTDATNSPIVLTRLAWVRVFNIRCCATPFHSLPELIPQTLRVSGTSDRLRPIRHHESPSKRTTQITRPRRRIDRTKLRESSPGRSRRRSFVVRKPSLRQPQDPRRQ